MTRARILSIPTNPSDFLDQIHLASTDRADSWECFQLTSLIVCGLGYQAQPGSASRNSPGERSVPISDRQRDIRMVIRSGRCGRSSGRDQQLVAMSAGEFFDRAAWRARMLPARPRINAPLKSIARLALQIVRSSGTPHPMLGSKKALSKKNLSRRVGHAGFFPAHHAGKGHRTIGDRQWQDRRPDRKYSRPSSARNFSPASRRPHNDATT